MSTWSESRMEYREVTAPLTTGPLERLWQAAGQETVFLSPGELARREQEARATSALETESRLKQDYQEALASSRRELIHSLASFQADRASYFRDMEREVVRLALAIARTVIERELQVNPALLQDAARDVLHRVESGSMIKLRVPSADVQEWRSCLAMEIDSNIKLELVGDGNAAPGQCTIETVLGTTNFDIAERLREIEATLLQCTATPEPAGLGPVIVQ